MNQRLALTVVCGLGGGVAGAGGALASPLITVVGLLSTMLAGGGLLAVRRGDLRRPPPVTGGRDGLEE